MILNFFFLIAIINIHCREYFIDKDSIGGTCDNDGPGTITQPFCKISTVDYLLEPGDIAYIRKGTYDEYVKIQVSGNESHPITVKNYDAEYPILTGYKYGTIFTDSNYMVLEGLRASIDMAKYFDQYVSSSGKCSFVGIAISGHHNIVRNCEVINDLDPYTQYSSLNYKSKGAKFRGSYNILEDCYIESVSSYGIGFDNAGSEETVPKYNIAQRNYVKNYWLNCFELNPNLGVITGNLVFNNTCIGSWISDGAQSNSVDPLARGYVIRKNIFFDFAENCVDVKGSQHILIEGNICSGGQGNNDGYWGDLVNDRGTAKAINKGSGTTSNRVIIRNNVIFDNFGGIAIYDRWVAYNNIVHNNNRDYTGPNSNFSKAMFDGIYAYDSGNVKNNLISHQHRYLISYQDQTDPPTRTLDTDYNAYMTTLEKEELGEDGKYFQFKLDGQGVNYKTTFDGWREVIKNEDVIFGKDENSFLLLTSQMNSLFFGVPLDANGEYNNYDFRSRPNSPLLEKGGPLTFTTSSGTNSKSIAVEDVNYFYDGYGFEDGDTIIITEASYDPDDDSVSSRRMVETKVLSIDYDNNILSVDTAVSWEEGDWVNPKLSYFYYDYVQTDPDGPRIPNQAPSIGSTAYDFFYGVPYYVGGYNPDDHDDDSGEDNDDDDGDDDFDEFDDNSSDHSVVILYVVLPSSFFIVSCCCILLIFCPLFLISCCCCCCCCVVFLSLLLCCGCAGSLCTGTRKVLKKSDLKFKELKDQKEDLLLDPDPEPWKPPIPSSRKQEMVNPKPNVPSRKPVMMKMLMGNQQNMEHRKKPPLPPQKPKAVVGKKSRYRRFEDEM